MSKPQVPIDQLKAEYEAGASLSDLAERYERSRQTLYVRLKKAGTVLRSRGKNNFRSASNQRERQTKIETLQLHQQHLHTELDVQRIVAQSRIDALAIIAIKALEDWARAEEKLIRINGIVKNSIMAPLEIELIHTKVKHIREQIDALVDLGK